MIPTLTEYISHADEQFQEECNRFEKMIGKPEFDRIKEAVRSAIRQGNFQALSGGLYRASVTLDSVDGSNIKNHLEERRYFRSTYHSSHGIPKEVLMAEFHKAIQSEFPEIHLKDLQTQYLSRIYTNSVFKDHSRVTIVTAGFLMVLTTIALCGLPIINEFCNPTPPICITIFFTQTKNV